MIAAHLSQFARIAWLALALASAAAARAEELKIVPLPDDPAATADDRVYMKRACELAREAVKRGSTPFGALLVKDNKILLEYMECHVTTHDVTKHAETGLISIATQIFDQKTLMGATLYSSSEPCTMCCGAIRWSGIGRVVYGTTEAQFERLNWPVSPRYLGARETLSRVAPQVEIVGPLMEKEGLEIHQAFWPHFGAHPE